MKKLGIAGLVLALGLAVMSCASAGASGVAAAAPDGDYRNAAQGEILFSAESASWESTALGYRGSFDFSRDTSRVSLTATQQLKGLAWVDIDPIQGYADGEIKNNALVLGDFKFFHIEEVDDDDDPHN